MIDKLIEDDVNKIRSLYNEGHFVRSLNKIYGKKTVRDALEDHRLPKSKRMSLIKNKNKDHWIWSEEDRKNWSEKCIKLHKEKRANSWKQHEQSYPEKFFMEFLLNEGFILNKDFFMEFPFSIWRADFYFPKIALVIEIDGNQHKRYLQRKIRDDKKDLYIKSQDIDVLRISWQALSYDSKTQLENIKNILQNKPERNLRVTNFTDNQLMRLNMIEEIKKEKVRKKEERKQKRKVFYENRIKTLCEIDYQKFGNLTKIANIWGVTHTQAKRFIKNLDQNFKINSVN